MSGFHRRFTLFVLAALLILAVGAGSCKAETDENGSPADTPPATTSQPGTTVTDTTTSPPVDTQPPVTTTESEPTKTDPPATKTQTPKATVTEPPPDTTISDPPEETTPPPTTTAKGEVEPTGTPVPPTTEQDPYKQRYHGYLLDGYPEDIWPLYGSLAVDSCALVIQTPAYNAWGEYSNTFYVVYVTDKEQEEVAEYYNSLLDEPTEPGGYYDARGVIGGYGVSARWSDFSRDYNVYLAVSLPNTPPATENPFFTDWPVTSNPFLADFPVEVFPLYEFDTMWSEYYSVHSNPPSGQIFADKMFAHTGTKTGALEFYRELLKDAEGYEEATSEAHHGERINITGSLHGHNFNITVGVWGRENMINVRIIEYA